MRVILIADVRGNAAALRAVLEHARAEEVDRVVVLGNAVFGGPRPRRVFELIKDVGAQQVLGDGDGHLVGRGVLALNEGDRPWLEVGRLSLPKPLRRRLKRTPESLRLSLGTRTVHLSHAGPWLPAMPLTPDLPDQLVAKVLTEHGADVMVVGYGGGPFVRSLPEGMLVSPGSVGLPPPEDPRASAMVLELGSDGSVGVEVLRVAYPIRRAGVAIRRAVRKGRIPHAVSHRYQRRLLGAPGRRPLPLRSDDRGSELLVRLLADRIWRVYGRATEQDPDDPVRHVHEIRVSTRRLREAIILAEPLLEEGLRRRTVKRQGELRRALGTARIVDVLIEHLDEIVPEDDGQHRVLAEARAMLIERRSGAQAAFAEAFSQHRLLRHGTETMSLIAEPADRRTDVRALAAARIDRCVQGLKTLLPSIDDPSRAAEHHELRIAFKRLRYTAEILAEPFADLPWKKMIRGFKDLQDALGLTHDVQDLIEVVSDETLTSRVTPDALQAVVEGLRQQEHRRFERAQALVRSTGAELIARLTDFGASLR